MGNSEAWRWDFSPRAIEGVGLREDLATLRSAVRSQSAAIDAIIGEADVARQIVERVQAYGLRTGTLSGGSCTAAAPGNSDEFRRCCLERDDARQKLSQAHDILASRDSTIASLQRETAEQQASSSRSAHASQQKIADLEREVREQAASIQILDQELRKAAESKSALQAQSAEREELLASRATEREAALEVQAAVRGEQIVSQASKRERELQAQATEREELLASRATEREAALVAEIATREAMLRADAGEREAKLSAEAAEREAALRQDLARSEAALASGAAEAESRAGQAEELQQKLLEIQEAESRQAKTISHLLELAQPYAVGDAVMANFWNCGWYPAEIAEARPDATYSVTWYDGDARDRVKAVFELRRASASDGRPEDNERDNSVIGDHRITQRHSRLDTAEMLFLSEANDADPYGESS